MKDRILSYPAKAPLFISSGLVLILLSSLVNSKYYYDATMAAFYGYGIVSCALILFGCILHIALSNKTKIELKLPITILSSLFIYILASSFFYDYFSLKHAYLLITIGLFIVVYLLFIENRVHINLLLYAVIVLTLFECILCFLQATGVVKSPNRYFDVTGSWLNPNVTAMFLAMALPIFFVFLKSSNKIHRNVSIAGVLAIISALIILECRSALLGAVISIIVFFWHSISETLRKAGKNSSVTAPLILVLFCLALATALHLYGKKKASADGRLLIWKLSVQMLPDRPIFGYGYGSFEKYYNRKQAAFFGEDHRRSTEVSNASHINMAYNEFIQNAVEGGVVGFALFTGLLFSMLVLSRPRHSEIDNPELKTNDVSREIDHTRLNKLCYRAAYAGIVVFCAMSMVNFTIEAVPVLCLLVFYGSFLTANSEFISFRELLSQFTNGSTPASLKLDADQKGLVRPVVLFSSLIAIIIILSYAAFDILSKSTADRQNKKARILSASGKKELAIRLLAPLGSELKEYASYWKNYGDILSSKGRYKEALQKYLSGLDHTSDPELYMRAGYCMGKLGDKKKAVQYYKIAKAMEPSRLAPRYAVMAIYYNSQNYSYAIREAKDLLATEVKVPSQKATIYRQRAAKVITKSQPFLKNQTNTNYTLAAIQ